MILKLLLIIFASFGFSLIINANRRHYAACALLGGASYLISTAIFNISDSVLLNSVISAILVSAISQVLARIKKAPATVFLLPSILPLVPGRIFFYAISLAITQGFENSAKYFSQTFEYAFGISIGIILGSFLCKILIIKAK